MSVLIKVEEIVDKNERMCYLIKKITGCFTEEELPKEYLDGQHFKWVTNGVVIRNRSGILRALDEGNIYSREYFTHCIVDMRICGKRLRKIRKQKNWGGEQIFVV